MRGLPSKYQNQRVLKIQLESEFLNFRYENLVRQVDKQCLSNDCLVCRSNNMNNLFQSSISTLSPRSSHQSNEVWKPEATQQTVDTDNDDHQW
jgi:hypothetical protein